MLLGSIRGAPMGAPWKVLDLAGTSDFSAVFP